MGKTNNDEVEVEKTPKSRKIPVYKDEFQIPKFSEPSQKQNINQVAVTEHCTSVGTMALTSHFSGDLQELDNQINTMHYAAIPM